MSDTAPTRKPETPEHARAPPISRRAHAGRGHEQRATSAMPAAVTLPASGALLSSSRATLMRVAPSGPSARVCERALSRRPRDDVRPLQQRRPVDRSPLAIYHCLDGLQVGRPFSRPPGPPFGARLERRPGLTLRRRTPPREPSVVPRRLRLVVVPLLAAAPSQPLVFTGGGFLRSVIGNHSRDGVARGGAGGERAQVFFPPAVRWRAGEREGVGLLAAAVARCALAFLPVVPRPGSLTRTTRSTPSACASWHSVAVVTLVRPRSTKATPTVESSASSASPSCVRPRSVRRRRTLPPMRDSASWYPFANGGPTRRSRGRERATDRRYGGPCGQNIKHDIGRPAHLGRTPCESQVFVCSCFSLSASAAARRCSTRVLLLTRTVSTSSARARVSALFGGARSVGPEGTASAWKFRTERETIPT